MCPPKSIKSSQLQSSVHINWYNHENWSYCRRIKVKNLIHLISLIWNIVRLCNINSILKKKKNISRGIYRRVWELKKRGYEWINNTKQRMGEREGEWYVLIKWRLCSTCNAPVITNVGKFSVEFLILPYALKQAIYELCIISPIVCYVP